MAKIFVRYNFTSVTPDVIMVWYANSAPNAKIGSWVLNNTTGHEKDGSHTITGLQATMHTIKFFQSSDGETLETLLPATLSIDATLYDQYFIHRYEYVVGAGRSESDPDTEELIWADPSDGNDTLTDKRLVGATNESANVHIQGLGDLQTQEVNWLEAGGFSFIDSETKFVDEQKVIVTWIEMVVGQAPDTEVKSDLVLRPLKDSAFTGGSVNFDASFYGKRCPIKYSGNVCQMVFPDFNLIPPGTILEVNTFQGQQIYFKLQFSSGNTVFFNGAERNAIHLPKMERIRLEWTVDEDTEEVVCYADYKGKAESRGQIVGDTGDRSATGPYLSCVETALPLSGDIYTGLYEWLLEQPAETKVSMVAWTGDSKTFWAIDTVAKTFRPPKVADKHRRFQKANEAAGTYIADDNKKHRHFTVGDEAINTNPPGVDEDTAIARDNELNGNLSYRLKKSALEPTLGRTSESGGGDEVTVKAYREIPLVIL